MEVEGEVVVSEYGGRENGEMELEMREENDNIELVVEEVVE